MKRNIFIMHRLIFQDLIFRSTDFLKNNSVYLRAFSVELSVSSYFMVTQKDTESR